MTATEWVDGYGRTWWQPTLENGDRLWHESNYADGLYERWKRDESKHGPVVYRSKARANRVAARAQRRRQARELRQIQPAKGQDT